MCVLRGAMSRTQCNLPHPKQRLVYHPDLHWHGGPCLVRRHKKGLLSSAAGLSAPSIRSAAAFRFRRSPSCRTASHRERIADEMLSRPGPVFARLSLICALREVVWLSSVLETCGRPVQAELAVTSIPRTCSMSNSVRSLFRNAVTEPS